MIMGVSKDVFREMIHWLWLWMLVAVAVSLGQSIARGDEGSEVQVAHVLAKQSNHTPMPIPDIKLPDEFRYPLDEFENDNSSLRDVIRLNRAGEYETVIKVWRDLHVTENSQTWKHIGMGAAHLRLDQIDEAINQLSKAIETDPENAVAEYFLGRVRQAQDRRAPFWYEKNDEEPFRLVRQSADDRGKAEFFLPHFKNFKFEKQAKAHFRRAITLSGNCHLDRPIRVLQPKIQLVGGHMDTAPITVRHLLISLGEENYVEKARHETELRFIHDDPQTRIGCEMIVDSARFH